MLHGWLPEDFEDPDRYDEVQVTHNGVQVTMRVQVKSVVWFCSVCQEAGEGAGDVSAHGWNRCRPA